MSVRKSRAPLVLLFLLLFLWLLPLLALLMSSLRPLRELRAGWWHLAGAHFTLENYRRALEGGLLGAFYNTVKIAGLATLFPLVAGTLAAYAIAKLRPRFSSLLYGIFLGTMLLPLQLILIPLFPWLRSLGLSDTHWGLVLVHTAFGLGWTLFHFVQFFQDIPDDLLESARLDGASELAIFCFILLPLSFPAVVAYAVLQFVWVWNDLLLALTLIQSPGKYPITVALVNLQSPHFPQWGVLAAGVFLSILPPMLLFLLLQSFHREALFKGAVRG